MHLFLCEEMFYFLRVCWFLICWNIMMCSYLLLNVNSMYNFRSSRPQTLSQYLWESLGASKMALFMNAIYISWYIFLVCLLNISLLSISLFSHASSSMRWRPRSLKDLTKKLYLLLVLPSIWVLLKFFYRIHRVFHKIALLGFNYKSDFCLLHLLTLLSPVWELSLDRSE